MGKEYWQQVNYERDPFPLETDGVCFISQEWQRYINFLKKTDHYRKALLLVVGNAYCGKSTLFQRFIQDLPPDIHCIAAIGAENFGPEHITHLLAEQLGEEDPEEEEDLYYAVEQQLIKLQATQKQYMLVIDQAEQLPLDTLKMCLYIVKYQIANSACLQIVLFGQKILLNDFEKLFQHHQDNINNYVINKLIIEPFDKFDTIDYIHHRLEQVGGDRDFFTDEELQFIYDRSEGLVGHINRVARQLFISKLKSESSHAYQFNQGAKNVIMRFRWWLGCLAIIIILLVWVLPSMQNRNETQLESNLPLPPSPQQQQQMLASPTANLSNSSAATSAASAPAAASNTASATVAPVAANAPVSTSPAPSSTTSVTPIASANTPTMASPTTETTVATAAQPTSNEKMVRLIVNGQVKRVPESSLSTEATNANASETVTSPATPVAEPVAPAAVKPGQVKSPHRTIIMTVPAAGQAAVTSSNTLNPGRVNSPHHRVLVMAKPKAAAALVPKSLSTVEQRLLKVNPHMYTLQLVALNNQTEAIKFVNQYRIASLAGVYPAKRHGKIVYIVTLGYFPSRQAALKAVPDLDPGLAKLKPWPRSYKDIHQDILGK